MFKMMEMYVTIMKRLELYLEFIVFLSVKLFASIINACCLALLDANISLKYTVAAVRCALNANTNEIAVFPSIDESKVSHHSNIGHSSSFILYLKFL